MKNALATESPAARGETSLGLKIERGTCHLLMAYDVGMAIDMEECERRISLATQRKTIKHRRRAPKYFNYHPPLLHITQQDKPIDILHYRTAPTVDLVLYDFGAVSVGYSIPIAGRFEDLLRLSDALYDHADLCDYSRAIVEQLLGIVQSAVTKPNFSGAMEDYTIYEIQGLAPAVPLADLRAGYASQIAQILRADSRALSEQEIADALHCHISFGAGDLAIVDWNSAMLFDENSEDVRAVLEFANVELLELRCLDEQLDRALEESYQTLLRRERRKRWMPALFATELKRVAMMQADSALLFEGINNALKLLGDQYLARLYRLASERFHHKEWDENILRKLDTLESIYRKMADESAERRVETLELVIIVLIAVSIVISFIPGLGH